jgi:predicted ATPase/class 3 adenylate cyclase
MEVFAAYIPMDRRHALARNLSLPDRSEGTALFADISGFTPLTEALTRALGPRRGAEELTIHLNSVYQALIHEVDRYGGSVIAFAGDAITCWFDGDDGWRSVTCALAMQATMAQFSEVQLPNQELISLAVKIGIARGQARRFLTGDSEIQVRDVLAGRTLSRMAAAAQLALRGETVVAPEIAAYLDRDLRTQASRTHPENGEIYTAVSACRGTEVIEPWPSLPPLSDSAVRPWLIRPVYDRLRAGQGEFLTELRPAVAIFVKFDGIDYDEDKEAGSKLGTYVRWVQQVMACYEGFLMDISIGDKGSYLYCCFGAPIAHENDLWRAATAAWEIVTPPLELGFVTATRVGVSCGTMRTGAYGGTTRRTYGVLGEEVNLAARLMEQASAGQVLVSERFRRAAGDAFSWRTLPAIQLKGKSQPVQVFAMAGPAKRNTPKHMERQYALELVGRAHELAVIRERIERVSRGQGQVLCLSAEAGMGKSRLVAEAIRLAESKGIKSYAGECQSHGTHTSYLSWHTIWQGLFGLDPGQPARGQTAIVRDRLAAIDPVLTARLPLLGAVLNLAIPENEVTAPLEARLRKASLESLLVECLRAIARREPVLLVVEDTHWIDALSQDLLDLLARSISRVPVFLLFTQRPREKGYVQIQGFEHLAHFTEVALNAFTDEEAARLITLKLAQLFGFSGPAPPVLAGRLVARSAGNPFYLEELLNFLKDEQVNFESADAIENLELPASLHSLVLSRVDRLTESQQGTLKIASVVGRLFPASVIWGIQPETDRSRITADLAQLCDADLTALERPEPELAYVFKHVVAQEVTYESLPHATRSKLHNQIGLCLERLFSDRLEQFLNLLAFHFDRSPNVPKKREYLLKAGEVAQANYANAAAISYYERALPLLEPAESINALIMLGKVRELTGDWKQAGACYQQGFEVAEKLADHCAKARCQAAMGDLLRKQGMYADAISWLDISRSGFEEVGDKAGVGQVVHAMGTVAAMQGNYPEARSFYERSLAIRRQLDDQAQIASLLSNLGIIARFSAEYETARRLMEQSLEMRRKVGDRWAIANSLNNLGVLLRDLGELGPARALLEESLDLNRQVGDRWAIANTLSSLGEVTIDQKDWPSARGFLEQSLKINLDLGDRTAVAFILECFASMAASLGETPRALHLAGASSSLRATIGSPLSPAEQERLDRSLKPAWEHLPAEQTKALYDEGIRLTLEQAIEEAAPTFSSS